MTTWTYTKKIIMDNQTQGGLEAHENATAYTDWYLAQGDAGLVDWAYRFLPHCLASPTVYEILVTNQVQADSYIAMAYAEAGKIGHPLSATVVDVNYTTDTIPDNFVLLE
jgi:hypothetical protein